jgi:hypothetical protein
VVQRHGGQGAGGRGGASRLVGTGKDELGQRLRETNEARGTAERELAEVEGRRTRIEELERDRDSLLEHYSNMVPEALEGLTGEERHRVYRMLRLKAFLHPGGDLDVEGVLHEAVYTSTGTR